MHSLSHSSSSRSLRSAVAPDVDGLPVPDMMRPMSSLNMPGTLPTSASLVEERNYFLKERALRALNSFFCRLGGCRFRDATQCTLDYAVEINACLTPGIWQAEGGESLSESLKQLVNIEDLLASLRLVDLQGARRSWVQDTFERISADMMAAWRRASLQCETCHDWLVVVAEVLRTRVALVSRLITPFRVRVLTALSDGGWPLQAQEHYEALTKAEAATHEHTDMRMGHADSSKRGGDGALDPESWTAAVSAYGSRVLEELRVLQHLFHAYEAIMKYDFLGTTTSLYLSFTRLMQLAKTMELKASTGYDPKGSRMISEWWTQMDGYWGVHTTRALQQYLNAVLANHKRVEGDVSFECLQVDGNSSKKTHTVLQWHLNVQRSHMLTALQGGRPSPRRDDDISVHRNMPKPGLGRGANALSAILQKWPELPVDGSWNKETKTALQAFLKIKVPQASFNVDGRFHQMSARALQMHLAQEGWYRPGLHNDTNVHQSRVTMHCLELHKWLCALSEGLTANAALIFHTITSKKQVQRDMGQLSLRTAVAYYESIVGFVKKYEVHRVILVSDVSGSSGFSLQGYAIPSKDEDIPVGLSSLPDVFCYPREATAEWKVRHWPTVVSLLFEISRRLVHPTDPQFYHSYEQKHNMAYYYRQIEPRLYMVVMFEGNKRKATNGTVKRFINFVTDGLQLKTVLNILKPTEAVSPPVSPLSITKPLFTSLSRSSSRGRSESPAGQQGGSSVVSGRLSLGSNVLSLGSNVGNGRGTVGRTVSTISTTEEYAGQ